MSSRDFYECCSRSHSRGHAPDCRMVEMMKNPPPHDGGLMRLQLENAALKSRLAAAEGVVNGLQHCSGDWIGGSGGHRQHTPCNRIATWTHPDDGYAYCDEHVKDFERGDGRRPGTYYAACYADEARALDAAVSPPPAKVNE